MSEDLSDSMQESYISIHTELIDQVISRIQDSFSGYVSMFKGLVDEDSSSQALREAGSLYTELQQLQADLEEIHRKNSEITGLPSTAQEEVARLREGLAEIEEGLQALAINLGKLKEVAAEFGKEAGPDDMVEIVDILPKNRQLRSIKVKSDERNSGVLRNVRIWDIEDEREVCHLLLIEPGVEIKVLASEALTPTHHLIAKIGERLVSFPYMIPKMKIVSVTKGKTIEITVRSLYHETIQEAGILVDGVKIDNPFTLDPFEIIAFEINENIQDNAILYIEKEGELLSSEYQFKLYPDSEDILGLLCDLNDFQKELVIKAVETIGNVSYLYIKKAVLAYSPESIEDLRSILANLSN